MSLSTYRFILSLSTHRFILLPVQYSTQKIPKIRNVPKTIIFLFFSKISSNNISSPYTRTIKKLIKSDKVQRPSSETVILQRQFFVQK